MKIAYCLKMYPRFSETFIVNEILELERRKTDVRIYALHKPDDGRFHGILARVKANVIYLPEYPDREAVRVAAAAGRVAAAFPEAYASARAAVDAIGEPYATKHFDRAVLIAAHLLDHPVDAIHAHFASSATRVARLVNQLIGLPYSFTAHAKDIFHEDVRPESLRKKIRDARFVVTVSEFNRQHLAALMGDEGGDIRTLYNGIDLRRFRPPSRPGGRPGKILAIGRLVPKKGFDVLIEACGCLRDWGLDFSCDIIGKGEEKEALERRIAGLGLIRRVRLVGPRSQEDVIRAFRRAAIFTLPCIVGPDGNRDGLPTVLLEAMAVGLPVISTPLTGIPEIVDDRENGRLVRQNDPLDLARALAELLRDPALGESWGQAGRRKVERLFDVRTNAGRLREWLAEPAPIPAGAPPERMGV